MAREHGVVFVPIPDPIKSEITKFTQETINTNDIIEIEDKPHVTIKYGLTTENPEEVAAVICEFNPIRIMFGATKMFMADSIRNTDVVKIDVFGMSLNKIREQIEKNLETIDVYKTFQPHTTLAYVKKYSAIDYVGDNPVIGKKCVVDHVIFSDKNKKNYKISNTGEITCI
jgi:2'-5' RNA ligase